MFDWLKILIFDTLPLVRDFTEKIGAPFSSEEFTATYSGLVKDGQDIMIRLNEANAADVQKATKTLLITMAALVRAYYKANWKRASNTNANYMLPHPSDDGLLERALFCRKDRKASSFGCFLVLEQWANDVANLPGPGGLVLPVEGPDGNDQLLFGAPKAYVSGEPIVVNDTTAHDIGADHNNSDVRLDLKRYFERHEESFRSFVCLPVEVPNQSVQYRAPRGCSDRIIAVVNIQSDKPRLLGRFKSNQRKLMVLLVPFVHMLGCYLVRAQQLAEPTGGNGV